MGKNKGGDKNAGGGGGGKGAKGKGDEKDSGKKKANGQNIKIRHILCEKHSRKEEAKAKLNEGVSFNKVAEEFSEDKAKQGGSLGVKTKGSLMPEFEKVAWELDPSTVDKPIWGEAKTSEGYHIIMVEK